MIEIIDLKFHGNEQTIAAFLVRTSDGPVLIETGPHSSLPSLEKGLAAHGVTLQSIQHVFLSHIHLDHAGAAWYFAQSGAQIYVHPFGEMHLANPKRLMESARRIYKEDMDRLWGQMEAIPEQQLTAVDHETVISIGDTNFKAWHTPGHAVHHIAWQVNDVLFAGDVAGVKIGKGLVVPPCPPPDINVEDWQNSIQLMRSLDIHQLYLTHFGAIANIDEHLTELEKCLLEWANWMYPYWEQGAEQASVRPLFQKYVGQQLLAAGIDMEGLKRYESANPSWMSVAGLMRYWSKKNRSANSKL
ncbi:MAG: MBL fold metallo-hydrolase [Bacteroidota bacterium]